MTPTIAFDIYGTLYDTASIATMIQAHAIENPKQFAANWREEQIAITWRQNSMKRHEDFDSVTRFALESTCKKHRVVLTSKTEAALLSAWTSLKPFEATLPCLRALGEAGYSCWAFSNGNKKSLSILLEEVINELSGVITVEPVHSFKPDPAVYHHFCQATQAHPNETLLVSSNYWDITGARNAGWQAVWLHRKEGLEDWKEHLPENWTLSPTIAVQDLRALTNYLVENKS